MKPYTLTTPYYIVPVVEEYKSLDPDSPRAKELSRFLSANIGDYASLRLILGIDPPEFARFYPDMEISTPSTFDTIDSFLDKFGTNLPPGGYIPEENQAENTSTATYTIEEEELTDNTPVQENILGENQEKNTSATVKQTLKDLIKEKRYQEALVLIEAQNLNNTEKSIYFAHQIRFIKKLIALQKYQDKPRG